jgi:hypothetical protein
MEVTRLWRGSSDPIMHVRNVNRWPPVTLQQKQ